MGKKRPLFSVIIPTYNRPRQLVSCLESLNHLDYPRDRFEVIVVDDGSTICIDNVLAHFQNQYDVTLLKQPKGGPAMARNTGAARAKGEFLVFTDDDCPPAYSWLRALCERYDSCSSNRAIGGRLLNVLDHNVYSETSQILIDAVYSYYNANSNQARFFTSNNLCVPTKRFRSIGGFNSNFITSEDREFCARWLANGYNLTYAPEIIVYHAHHLSFYTFLKQHFAYGRGAFLFQQLPFNYNKTLIEFVPKLFYLLVYPLMKKYSLKIITIETLLIISQLASACGYLWGRMHRTDTNGS
jgi:glycosyltransferase involved in cell wall biosynthesis